MKCTLTMIKVFLFILCNLGDLLDGSDIRANDIVPGATVQLNVWPMWKDLIDAASSNDIEWVR